MRDAGCGSAVESGVEEIYSTHRPRRDFALLNDVDHSAQQLLEEYKTKGVPVQFFTAPWFTKKVDAAISRGAHPSCNKSLELLCKEFVDMINKDQFVILNVVKELPGLCVLPIGVIPQER